MENTPHHTPFLEKEFRWFSTLLNERVKSYINDPERFGKLTVSPPPEITPQNSYYEKMVRELKMSPAERLVLLLALAPHIRPQALDVLHTQDPALNQIYTIFGVQREERLNRVCPTGETALFLLAGSAIEARFEFLRLFSREHFFAKTTILKLESTAAHTPDLHGRLLLSDEFLSQITTGRAHRPEYSRAFPAQYITTALEWEDLIVDPKVLKEIKELEDWMTYKTILREDWGLGKKIKEGYRALFYGPSGAGKTFTVSLLGKSLGLDVYRIDLSMLISKYIGETEKNLAQVFDQAAHKDWILFFDEADALFGKRTQTKDAHDRYANQEVAYLLQKIEDFPGMVILASNQKDNIDKAFARRFQLMIEFPIPAAPERLLLWKNAFSGKSVLESAIDLAKIAEEYEVTGGMIVNVLQYVSLMALSRNSNLILLEDLIEGIRREFKKAGKFWITPK